MEIIEAHDKALAATGQIIASITKKQLSKATPCSEYDVKALLNHLVGANRMFAAVAQGEELDPARAADDHLGDDYTAAFEQSAKTVSEAWKTPGLLEKTVKLPFAEMPGAAALGIHTVEALVHGWDLGTATGQAVEFDPALAEVAWDNVKNLPDMFRGPAGSGMPFGLKVEPPANATPTQRVVAWLGRQP
jgi:uncharacterized protein (TIGR03086 family)